MYNLRTRVKAVSAGSAQPQAEMRARALPAAASQVTSTQALELLGDDIETVPETEMYGESVDRTSNAENDVIETVRYSASYSRSDANFIANTIHGYIPGFRGPVLLAASIHSTREPYRCSLY